MEEELEEPVDSLLKGDSLAFSIDEISVKDHDKNNFTVKVIPDMDSKDFPPFHLRYVNVSPELLSREFFQSINNNEKLDIISNINFKSSVIQGGYYLLNKNQIATKTWTNMFKDEFEITTNNNVFTVRIPSPYDETKIRGGNVMTVEEGSDHLSTTESSKLEGLYLYCFNVGQGDSFLIITPNGNSYIVDMNVTYNRLSAFNDHIQGILSKHGLNKRRIKALVITHKHIDHIRGAKDFILSGLFSVENFLVNLDYSHPTKPVFELFKAARKNIPTWININRRGLIMEGSTLLHINNPDYNTVNSAVEPNINDSSITLCLEYKGNYLYLTGDASYPIILDKFKSNLPSKDSRSFLKVSHHGSVTGTDNVVLNNLSPNYAFVSAGTHRGYKHPHQQTVNLIKGYSPQIDLKISKLERCTTEYTATETKLECTKYLRF